MAQVGFIATGCRVQAQASLHMKQVASCLSEVFSVYSSHYHSSIRKILGYKLVTVAENLGAL
jgi:hypothetical protein